MKSTIVITGVIAALFLIGCPNPVGITLPNSLDSADKAAVPQTASFIAETGDKIVARAETLNKDDTVSLSIEGNTVIGTVTSITPGTSTAADGRFISPVPLQAASSTVRYTVDLSFTGSITGTCTVVIYDDGTWKIDGNLNFKVKDDQGTDQTATVDFDQTTISGEGEITSGEVKVNDTAIDNGYGNAMTQLARFAAVLDTRLKEDDKSISDYTQLESIKVRVFTNAGYSATHSFTDSDAYYEANVESEAIESLGPSGAGILGGTEIYNYSTIHENSKYKLAYQAVTQTEQTYKMVNGKIDKTETYEYTYTLGGSGTVYDVDTVGNITVAVNLTGRYDENYTRYWNGSITVNGVQIAIDNMTLTSVEAIL